MKWDRFERFLTIVVAAAALVAVGLTLRREFRTPAAGRAQVDTLEFEPHWRAAVPFSSAIRRGSPSGDVLLVVSDYECPGCALFEESLRVLEDSTDVAIGILHLPLRQHRFARSAAQAAICAEDQGRFRAFHLRVFDAQDSLGLVSFRDIAAQVGVPDIERFGECTDSPSAKARVDSSSVQVRRLGVRFTPTVLLNGWRFPRPPSAEAIQSELARQRRERTRAATGSVD